MRFRFRLLVFASCLCALALGGFFDGHARADIDNTAAPPPWQCRVITGTDGPNLLKGTDAYCDLIDGGKGDDTIYGYAKGDRLYGEQGGDLIYGGYGPDLVVAGCVGGTCDPGSYGNWLYGQAGDDVLGAENGYKDYLYGGSGQDICYADGRDVVSGCESIR
jgi:Ca2+-binding RTX toxin-like protein